MDSIGALGLGVVALSMLALSNNDKKETNNKKINEKIDYSTESTGGNPEYNEINIKNNMNNYVLYKEKYLKQKKLLKKNMKGGASAVESSVLIFSTGESVEEFIQQVINIYQIVSNELRKGIIITGSSAIAIVLYSLGLFEELAKMEKPADFDFLYDKSYGSIDIHTTFTNIKFISGNSESSTWKINNSTHTFDITGINTKSFNTSFILSNFPIRIVNLNTMIIDYSSDIDVLNDYIQNNIENNDETNYNLNINKQLRKINRLQHLQEIIQTIEQNKLESNYGMETTVSAKTSSFSPGDAVNLFGNSNPGTPVAPKNLNSSSSTSSGGGSASPAYFTGFETPVAPKYSFNSPGGLFGNSNLGTLIAPKNSFNSPSGDLFGNSNPGTPIAPKNSFNSPGGGLFGNSNPGTPIAPKNSFNSPGFGTLNFNFENNNPNFTHNKW